MDYFLKESSVLLSIMRGCMAGSNWVDIPTVWAVPILVVFLVIALRPSKK